MTFFLSPFILHRLGDDAFGLWVLVFSITGYYGLFDLGIRSSVIKYVAKYAATGEYPMLTSLINTSLFSYGVVAAVLLLITGFGAWQIDSIFHIAPAFLHTARWLFLMVGTSLALSFPVSVFSGVLQGLQQYHWLNLIQVASNLLRALLIVLALNRGGGLLTVAMITVSLPFLVSCVYILIVHHLIPVSFRIQYVDRRVFRQLINYGFVTFMIIVAEKLRFQSDTMVIGIFLSAASITYFAIGAKLVDYANNVVDAMADTFLPMSSHFDSTNDWDRMRKLFISGNRACALVIFPICATLIILGRSIIEAWVGPKYLSSYAILVLLIVPRTIYRAQGASTRILFGMARHKSLAIAVVAEGVVNLFLSILLIRRFGIIGDAVGTAIPLLCTSLIFLPYYLCRLLRVRFCEFINQSYAVPVALCVPLVALMLLMRHLFYAHNYFQLLVQLLAGGIVYATGLLWYFFTHEPLGLKLRARFGGYVEQGLDA
ncbi:MAG TPA: polysaccharide biosynthesis C-terminal domain-containing protein [Terriglobales bacterium]|nr:polysaccharide biosynthesis C-terminal domain-containing protein [Terriglobales bacterium]